MNVDIEEEDHLQKVNKSSVKEALTIVQPDATAPFPLVT